MWKSCYDLVLLPFKVKLHVKVPVKNQKQIHNPKKEEIKQYAKEIVKI